LYISINSFDFSADSIALYNIFCNFFDILNHDDFACNFSFSDILFAYVYVNPIVFDISVNVFFTNSFTFSDDTRSCAGCN